ncbi:hypothetical protein HHK36_029390 [Tetracentron sinense]|uniref:Uncharacterized protein n=1 Tax=Tetracentron sinense TaxID=13715 RepID=A0A835D1R4_TETSI|nr:hypothetical protein HHK36_029390 [Tetracentron sinense]
MTMVPAQNLFKQHPYDGYGGCRDSYTERIGLMSRLELYDYCSEACSGSDLVVSHMAEDESRPNSLNEAGSSSKDAQEEERDEGWLQLGIGDYTNSRDRKHDPVKPTAPKGGLVELNLLPGGTTQHVKPLAPIFHVPEFRAPCAATNLRGATSFSTPLFLQHPRTSSIFPQPEVTWGYRPNPWNITASSSSMPRGPYIAPPFQLHTGVDVAGPSYDFRVVDAPRRPNSGIWFVLQASQNQAKEPFLPQIPKSYLRIKDGRMTVRLLMKYLVNKLRLDSESEIEITCREQQLLPCLTLQHVRDNIWSSREAVTLLPDSSTTDHVMILRYGRSV